MTEVIRLYCPSAHQDNNQYTITILPSWLQPYLRRLVEFVTNAVGKYIFGFSKGYSAAAIEMGAESDRTFRRYFYRVRSRIIDWNTHLAMLLTAANISPQSKRQPAQISSELSLRWEVFLWQTKSYCNWLEKNKYKHPPLFGEWQMRHILALLNSSVLGLGP